MASRRVGEIFGSKTFPKVFLGGRDRLDFADLEASEKNAVKQCIQDGLRKLQRVSPEIARTVQNQEQELIQFAGVAKATFPEEKIISYPGTAGNIGVAWLTPQFVQYNNGASSTYPCYTDYTLNKWELSLTAGTTAYLLGDSSNLYKASPTTNQHTFNVIMQDGIIEVGSSPRLVQMVLEQQGQEGKYAPWTPHTLMDQTIQPDTNIYQYQTLGMIPCSHDFGTRLKVLPNYTGTADIRLLGITFYEFDFMSDLSYIS